ncbi:hypothetical protein SUGI_0717600 [Cryptomeria japonica]|nr:hypothetical protein SUGI_0717600 [Cryptomeria japonica]
MVFAQMVNAAVQETAMLLKRLMPQNPILDVFRVFLCTKLGNGGFDSVYEGVLSDSSKIAVKRLDRAGQGKWEFRAEVETLRKIDHLNLVNNHVIIVFMVDLKENELLYGLRIRLSFAFRNLQN